MPKDYREQLQKNSTFQAYSAITINYDLESAEYEELKEKYQLEQLKEESDFTTCKNVLTWVNKTILHMGNYDGSDKQDALTLLKRGYKTENGINCLSLSIVLSECLLALGVRARVVYMMPEAIDDGDNHVVAEAYVSEWKRWIMLDATYGSYCIDERGTVLNLYEIRNAFITGEKIDFSENLNYNGDIELDIEDIENYYAKNVFFFRCKREQGYGTHREHENMLEIAPVGFNVHERMVSNLEYRIREFGECDYFSKWLRYETGLENVYLGIGDFYK